MMKYPMVVICLLAFIVGAAAAGVVYHRQPRVSDGVRGPVESSADAGSTHGGETAASAGRVAADAAVEQNASAGEAVEGEVESAREVARPVAVPRARAALNAGVGVAERTGRRYAGASSRRPAGGGRGVAGHLVGGVKRSGEGVKKAGSAIGKTFGKIGGVFHD